MMVIGILAVLMTIVIAVVNDSIKAARSRRTDSLCKMVQTGLATYYAQTDEWPQPLGGKVANGFRSSTNSEGTNGRHNSDLYVLTGAEVRQMVKALVEEAKKGNPLVDVSGLFVSRDPGESGKGYGMDFFTAVRGDKRSKKRMTTSEMYFGYPDASTGHFRRFKMVYSIPADQLMVSAQ